MPQGTGSKKADKYYTATFTSPGYTGFITRDFIVTCTIDPIDITWDTLDET